MKTMVADLSLDKEALRVCCNGKIDRHVTSGRGAAWLARLLGVQEVPGSNPGGPTINSATYRLQPLP
jgi:hypothetical protein